MKSHLQKEKKLWHKITKKERTGEYKKRNKLKIWKNKSLKLKIQNMG